MEDDTKQIFKKDRKESANPHPKSLYSNNDKGKLEWMYKSGSDANNREEYLLGRSVDKSFEQLQAKENIKDSNQPGIKQIKNIVEHECVPVSIREYKKAECTEQVDMQRKLMEDPVMFIKQKEIESRRKLLENPVRLKRLHSLLATEKNLRDPKLNSIKSGTMKRRALEQNLNQRLRKQYKKLKYLCNSAIATDSSLKRIIKIEYENLYLDIKKTAFSNVKHKERSHELKNEKR